MVIMNESHGCLIVCGAGVHVWTLKVTLYHCHIVKMELWCQPVSWDINDTNVPQPDQDAGRSMCSFQIGDTWCCEILHLQFWRLSACLSRFDSRHLVLSPKWGLDFWKQKVDQKPDWRWRPMSIVNHTKELRSYTLAIYTFTQKPV